MPPRQPWLLLLVFCLAPFLTSCDEDPVQPQSRPTWALPIDSNIEIKLVEIFIQTSVSCDLNVRPRRPTSAGTMDYMRRLPEAAPSS
jgi:hypothetical protein